MKTSKKLMIYFFPLVLALLILAIIIIVCLGVRMSEMTNELLDNAQKIAELEEALENIPIIQVG